MSSAAKQDAAASVTATEWPSNASNSAAVMVESPVLSPYHFLRASRTQACMRWGLRRVCPIPGRSICQQGRLLDGFDIYVICKSLEFFEWMVN
jgi:hypothetical protein